MIASLSPEEFFAVQAKRLDPGVAFLVEDVIADLILNADYA